MAPAPASADADARLSRSASLRLALSTLTQPVHWLLLQAGPETPLPQLADAQTRESFNEQLRARVEDRLESSENLLLLGADRFLVSAPGGISQDRADALRQGLQTALVFYEGQRMRLKASTHLLTVRPGMRVEDVDAAIHQQLHRDSDSGLPGGTGGTGAQLQRRGMEPADCDRIRRAALPPDHRAWPAAWQARQRIAGVPRAAAPGRR